MTDTLEALEARLDWERTTMAYPDRVWPLPHQTPEGAPILDVLIIGGGLIAFSIATRLQREGITNFRIYDENPRGNEGPWVTYARMITLRTEKRLHGPDGGYPSATFRAWFEAQFGARAYEELNLIDKGQWMQYLNWIRRVFDLPLENEVRVTALRPVEQGFRVETVGPDGACSVVARKVIAATGLAGGGGSRVPAGIGFESLPRSVWAHSMDAIDFQALAGRRVAVIGGNASAFDNSATALDFGAREVRHFVRRDRHPERNTLRYLEFSGMFRHFARMDDALRHRAMRNIIGNAVPPPLYSIDRCAAHANFRLDMATGWDSVEQKGDAVVITTSRGEKVEVDFIILGTGFTVDLSRVAYLAGLHQDILLWRDIWPQQQDGIDVDIGRHPYLGPNLECRGRTPEAEVVLRNLFLANAAAMPSFGFAPGMNTAPYFGAAVVEKIVKDLFLEDAATFVSMMDVFEHSEFSGEMKLQVVAQ